MPHHSVLTLSHFVMCGACNYASNGSCKHHSNTRVFNIGDNEAVGKRDMSNSRRSKTKIKWRAADRRLSPKR